MGTFFKEKRSYYYVISVGTLIISNPRPEYYLCFLIFFLLFVLYSLHDFRNLKNNQSSYIYKSIARMIVIALLIYSLGFTLFSDRSMDAFSQHFALNYVSWSGDRTVNPWTENHKIVKSVFGDSKTIFQAARSNPAFLLRHFKENTKKYIHSFFGLSSFVKHFNFILPAFGNYFSTLEGGLILCIIFAYMIKNKSQILLSIKNKNRESLNNVLVLFVVFLFQSLVTMLIVYPTERYFLLCGVMLMALISLILNTKDRITDIRKACIVGILFLALTPAPYAHGYYMSHICHANSLLQSNKKSVAFIKSLNIDKKDILTGSAYDRFLGDDYKTVFFFPKKKDMLLGDFIVNNEINMVIYDKSFRLAYRKLAYTEELKSFFKNPQTLNFVPFKVPDTNVVIFIKKTLIPS